MPDDAREGRIDWRARELPVSAATCTVNGFRYRADEEPWTGLDMPRAVLREKTTIMMVCLGRENAPADHHLDVPWCHPDDQPEGWSDEMRYRVRPRRKGWRFQQIDGQWRLVRPASAAGKEGQDGVRNHEGRKS